MNVSISHPTDRPNYTVVQVGMTTLWFSYRTCVGFQTYDGPIVASENVWGPTTGKHLNLFSSKEQRIGRQQFIDQLQEAMRPLSPAS